LCSPSYVVTNMEGSSTLLCTFFLTGQPGAKEHLK
jgi:hypothetical protein